MTSVSSERGANWAIIIGTLLLFGIGFISVVENRSPSNILRPSGDTPPYAVASVVKQGWTFFTRDGREPKVSLYRATEGGFEKVQAKDSALSPNVGFSREGRLLGFETSMLLEKHPFDMSEWVVCNFSQRLECIERTPSNDDTDIEISGRFICGDIALLAERPIPFSYANLTTEREIKVLKTHVNCPNG